MNALWDKLTPVLPALTTIPERPHLKHGHTRLLCVGSEGDRVTLSDLSVLTEALRGQTVTAVESGRDYFAVRFGDLEVVFVHVQECCEDVSLEEVLGEIRPGERLVSFTVAENWGPTDLEVWTFYRIETDGGECTLRFCAVDSQFYSIAISVVCCLHDGQEKVLPPTLPLG